MPKVEEVFLEKIYYDKKNMNLIARWRNYETIFPILRTPYDTSPDQQEAWVKKILNDKICQYYYIFHNCQIAGYCGFDKIDGVNRTAEISMLIAPHKQKKGVGKKVTELLLDIAFNRLNINLVYAEVNGNSSNKEFWEKCGFKFDGELRSRKYINKIYYPTIIMSIMQHEWGNDESNGN